MYRCSDVLKTANETSEHLTGLERSAFSHFCKLVALHAKGQDIDFLCKGDLMTLCDEDSAQALFEYSKGRYRLDAPYVISC